MREALKLCFFREAVNEFCAGRFFPVHIEVHPTNRCNLKCSYCMYRNLRRDLELSHEEISSVLRLAKSAGCRAVTFSGGEPLLHPKIREILGTAKKNGLLVEVSTNGHRLRELGEEDFRNIDAVTVGIGDGRIIEKLPGYWKILDRAINIGSTTLWRFSYVVTDSIDYEMVDMVLSFVEANRVEEVVFVQDVNSSEDCIVRLRRYLKRNNNLHDWMVFSEKRKYVGTCYSSAVSPVLAADGYWYPCGVSVTNTSNKLCDKRLVEGLKDLMFRTPVKKRCSSCYKSEINCAVDSLRLVRFPEFI